MRDGTILFKNVDRLLDSSSKQGVCLREFSETESRSELFEWHHFVFLDAANRSLCYQLVVLHVQFSYLQSIELGRKYPDVVRSQIWQKQID